MPPRSVAWSACGTSAPAGAKTIAASTFSGGASAAPPTKSAPIRRAISRLPDPRVMTDSTSTVPTT